MMELTFAVLVYVPFSVIRGYGLVSTGAGGLLGYRSERWWVLVIASTLFGLATFFALTYYPHRSLNGSQTPKIMGWVVAWECIFGAVVGKAFGILSSRRP